VENHTERTKTQSYLANALGAAASFAFLPDEIFSHSTGETLASVAKTTPLFIRNRAGFLGAGVLFALDQAKSSDTEAVQTIDALLGLAKGFSTALLGEFIFSGTGGPAGQGVAFGIGSRALEVALTRQNYMDRHGNFSISEAWRRGSAVTFDNAALGCDLITLGISGKIFGKADAFFGGALRASPFSTTVSTGLIMGTTGGALGALYDRHNAPADQSILKEAIFHGALGAFSSVAGGIWASRAYRARAKGLSDFEQAKYDRWHEFRLYGENPGVPGQGPYLSGHVTAAEFQALRRSGKTAAEIMDWKAEINRVGTEVAPALSQAMRECRVLGLGECHIFGNPWRALGAKLIPELAKSGATHLALELTPGWQKYLDRFSRTGLPPATLAGAISWEDIPLLYAARRAGMKIVAVDGRVSSDRERVIASNIGNILQESYGNKVVLWIGAGHVRRGTSKNRAFDYLHEKFPVTSVNGIHPLFCAEEMAAWSSSLKRPLAIRTSEAPITAQAQGLGYANSTVDYMVLLPRPSFALTRATVSALLSHPLNPMFPYAFTKALINI
jgi:hypothetical protein